VTADVQPSFSLDDRIAIVTGAASGIGRAIACGMSAAGARVVLVDVDEPGLEESATIIEPGAPPGREALCISCDVSVEAEVDGLYRRVAQERGTVDVLVNNAFVPAFGRPESITLAEWQRSLAVNLTGYFLCARLAARAMMASQRGGSIINIASVAGVSALGRGNFAYSVAKGGVVQMTRELAVEWGRHGIRVNALLPVQTRTKGFLQRLDAMQEAAPGLVAQLVDAIPMGRLGEPTDLVGPAIFLASEAAGMVSGAIIPVDGGNLAMNAGARARG